MNQQILNEIQSLKQKILPKDRLILFGSQARGDDREDSDWDLLVLLNKEKRDYNKDFDKYAFPFAELGWSYGVAINPKIYTKEQWENGKSFLFYKNVSREGIEIK